MPRSPTRTAAGLATGCGCNDSAYESTGDEAVGGSTDDDPIHAGVGAMGGVMGGHTDDPAESPDPEYRMDLECGTSCTLAPGAPTMGDIIADNELAHAWCRDYPLVCAQALDAVIRNYYATEKTNTTVEDDLSLVLTDIKEGRTDIKGRVEALESLYEYWMNVYRQQQTSIREQLDEFRRTLQ